MTSSNRHWPSMFKSKPCNNQLWSQHNLEITPPNPSILSNSSPRSGCEERSPEPKPRWNPRPEQVRILETIFNSGMVNPPRDEIRRIRAQLQEYGPVGDANVFYWFQNRKSRSKHKQQRHHQGATNKAAATTAAASSSSSTTSSEKASPKNLKSGSPKYTTTSGGSNTHNNNNFNNTNNNIHNINHNINNSNNNSNNVTVDQFGLNNNTNNNNSLNLGNQGATYFHQLLGPTQSQMADFMGPESMYFPGPITRPYMNQGLEFGGGDGIGLAVSNHGVGGFPTTILLGDMIGGIGGPPLGGLHVDINRRDENLEKFKYQEELGFMATNPTLGSGNNVTTCAINIATPPAIPNTTSTCPISNSTLGQFLGIGDPNGIATIATIAKSTVMVFIDEMAVEVPAGVFNVREAFGEDAMLVHPTGQPVLTDEWGALLSPLQHGGLYYLVRTPISATPLLDKLDSPSQLLAPGFPYQI